MWTNLFRGCRKASTFPVRFRTLTRLLEFEKPNYTGQPACYTN